MAHIGISGCGFQLLSLPKNQSAGPTPVPAKPQRSVIFSHHNPLVTEFRTPAFLKNGRVWISSTSTHRSRSPGTQLPTTWILLCGLILPHWGLGPPRPSFPHSLVLPCLACCLQASWGYFAISTFSNPDPWISAAGPALAQAPGLPSGPAPFLFSPGVLFPEPKSCPWRSLKKVSLQWSEGKYP